MTNGMNCGNWSNTAPCRYHGFRGAACAPLLDQDRALGKIEMLEQLRWLQAGLKPIVLAEEPVPAVDTIRPRAYTLVGRC